MTAINAEGFAPVLEQKDKASVLLAKFVRPTRRGVIADVVADFYKGKHDWKYCRRMGWRVVRIKITAVE